jgi:chorismate dehydratase
MLFGSISYLNLLPFQLFLKRYIKNSASKMAFRYNRGVPSAINHALKSRKVNAAFISSIESKGCKCSNLGIVAKGSVYSVFVLPNQEGKDPASATSNHLAQVLGIKGRVLIGDKALKYYLDGGEGIDLANEWYKRTKLPFVFARLCYNKHDRYIKKLAKRFAKSHIKIPQYILKKEAKKRGISPKELEWYLQHIHYDIDHQAQRGLKKFLKS